MGTLVSPVTDNNTMCGIAGFLGSYDRAVVEDMTGCLAHRGPDGRGTWFDAAARIGLGHTRLSIIDLSDAARQPMPGVEGRYQIVFNGEIYNFRDHIAGLEARGYSFNTRSDTAVIPALYDMLGPSMLNRLNGIFAFAIWDSTRRRLFVARDHFGVKPVYFSQTPRGFVFASEIKALLSVPDVDRTVDPTALSQYLLYQWCPGPDTPFRSIKRLLPGHYLQADASGVREVRWYEPPFGHVADFDRRSSAVLQSELRTLVDQVVERQSVSDVSVGAFLSGGVDSSAVVATMAKRRIPIKSTYCISFRGALMSAEGFGDDIDHARTVADRWNVPLVDVPFHEPTLDELESIVFRLEEPLGDLAPLLVRAISKAARADGIKVMMSGSGGDDVFSGYRRHQVARLADTLPGLAPLAGAAAAFAGQYLPGIVGARMRRFGAMMTSDSEDLLHRLFVFNPPQRVRAIAGAALREQAFGGSEWFRAGLARTRGAPMLERTLAGEFLGFVPDHNLNYTDKAAMAEGVEVRVPLHDPALAEFASRLHPATKMGLRRPKAFFKQAMSDRLPATLLSRVKTGFGVPLRQWLSGALREPFLDIIRSRAFRERGLFRPDAIESMFGNGKKPSVSDPYLILAVVMNELWCRRFADGASVARSPARAGLLA